MFTATWEKWLQTGFSSKETWKQIRVYHQTVTWSNVVWFPQAIPHFFFITWLTIKDRLSAGAKSRAWGYIQHCILCGKTDETIDHLFFTCPYSFTVWIYLIGFLLGSRMNPDWSITLVWLLSIRRNEIDICLLKLAVQVTVHILWRERNSRRHDGDHHRAAHMVRFIDKTIKNMSSSLRHRGLATFFKKKKRTMAWQDHRVISSSFSMFLPIVFFFWKHKPGRYFFSFVDNQFKILTKINTKDVNLGFKWWRRSKNTEPKNTDQSNQIHIKPIMQIKWRSTWLYKTNIIWSTFRYIYIYEIISHLINIVWLMK